MAKAFPAADFLGIDIVRVPSDPSASRPGGGGAGLLRMSYDSDDEAQELPNVSFERGDITAGINYPDSVFDVVHCRSVLSVAVSCSIP